MALTLVSMKCFSEANALYQKAIETMASAPHGALEQAITYLNMADLYQEMKGSEEAESDVYACLDKAYELLKDPNVAEPGYYAFVLEKCAPTFSYYGYFGAAREFEKRAGEIYGKS